MRRVITDEVMRAIQDLSGQEYVPIYASTRKEELPPAPSSGGAGYWAGVTLSRTCAPGGRPSCSAASPALTASEISPALSV